MKIKDSALQGNADSRFGDKPTANWRLFKKSTGENYMTNNSRSGWAPVMRTIKTVGAGAFLTALAFNSAGVSALDEEHDFDGGQVTLNCSGNCPKVSTKYVRAGKYSIESTISDSSSNIKRTEAVIPGTAKFMDYDRDYWIGFSVYLPAGWQVPNDMELLAQIHRSTTGGGQPPVALYTGSGDWKLTSQSWGGKKDWFLNSVYEDVGRWTDFVIHFKPSDGSNGILEVWKDGGLVAQRLGPNTPRDSKGPYFKLGIYKGKYSAPSKTVYHDEFRVASGPSASYEDVAPGNYASGGGSSSGSTPEPVTPPSGSNSGAGSAPDSGSNSGSGSSTGSASQPDSGSNSGGDYVSLLLDDGQTISGDTVVEAKAEAAAGVSKVKFFVNGKKVGPDGKPPYTYDFDGSRYAGQNVTFTAVAMDKNGDTVSDEVVVRVAR
jgi:hypothetical protein